MPDAPPNFGVGSWIERRARVAPAQVALVAGERSFSYADLARRVRRLANGLRRLGWARRPGGVAGTEPPAFLESLFASGLLGAALAPVNHRLAAGEIRAVLADTEPRVLIQHGATDLVPAPASVRRRISVAGPGTGGRRGGGRVRRASPGSAVTEQEILVFARQRLGAHQAPASVTFVDRLPRNPVGKLVRARLGTLGGRP